MAKDITAQTLAASIIGGIGIAGVALLAGCAPADVPVWRVYEITLSAEGSHPRPSQVDLWATVSGPGGERLRVPGFWDGGNTWRVRFAPTSQGRWSWITQAADAKGAPLDDPGLQGVTGEMRAGPASGDNRLYQHGGFLRVSVGREHGEPGITFQHYDVHGEVQHEETFREQ